jgi:tRNA-Thr(GGU) m(6)t(6)A37 methyltransferase TsaA
LAEPPARTQKSGHYLVEPIALVSASRRAPEDDHWGGEIAKIRLVDSIDAAALTGLAAFSHVEVIFLFDRVSPDKIVTGARHPRNNEAWPKVGIFAQRGKNRPNRIGSTICRLVGVEGRTLRVQALDAIDGTPVIDIKPVMKEFLPREATTQPRWATELMSGYWTER